jgi:winged helix DNA-binding protein
MTPPPVPARLLPAFDVYVAGSRPKEALVEKRFEPRVYRQAEWISPVLIVDGKVSGVWSYERVGGRIEVAVEPFGKLAAASKRAIGEEIERLGEFLDTPASASYHRLRN